MDKTVSAADAGRHFSKVLRTVLNGRSVVVTKRGKPVARIVPVVGENRVAEAARSALIARLKRQRVVKSGRWTREDDEGVMRDAIRATGLNKSDLQKWLQKQAGIRRLRGKLNWQGDLDAMRTDR